MRDTAITIEVPDGASIGAEIATLEAVPARITTAEERIAVSERVGRCKAMLKRVGKLFAEAKKSASDAHKAVCAAERKLIAPINRMIECDTSRMLNYDREQAAIRKAEEDRLRREAQEKADAEKRRLEAVAARCKNEEKREAYQQAAQAVTVAAPVLPPDADRASGEVRSVRWEAEVTDIHALIKAAAAGDVNAIACLAFAQSSADKLARAFRRDGVVPGVRFSGSETISHRFTK